MEKSPTIRRPPARIMDVGAHAVFAVLGAALWLTASQSPRPTAVVAFDFVIYREAARRLAYDDVYDRSYLGLPFAYPPSSLAFLQPTTLPTPFGQALWFALGMGAIWVTMRLIAQAAAPGSWWSRPGGTSALAAAGLLTHPIQHALLIGQVTPLLMGVVAVATLGRNRRSDGVLVGLATSVKLTPALFAAWWWLVGRRRDALVAAATFGVAGAVGWVLMPRSSRHYFLEGGFLALEGNTPAEGLGNQAILGVALRVGVAPGWALPVSVVVGVLFAVWILGVSRRLSLGGWAGIAVPLVGVGAGLAAPLGWSHAFVWWAPLAAAIALSRRGRADLLIAALIFCSALIPIRDSVGRPLTSMLYLVMGAGVTLWLRRRTPDGAS